MKSSRVAIAKPTKISSVAPELDDSDFKTATRILKAYKRDLGELGHSEEWLP